MLAGGKYWAEIRGWEQGAYAVDTAAIRDAATPPSQSDASAEAAVDEAIADYNRALDDMNRMSRKDILSPDLQGPGRSPAKRIIEALSALGWAPAMEYPEGVQVWTISGIPDGGRSDGTQAYFSLPSRKDEHRFDFQDRGDIWLGKPTVTVNFEVPRTRL
ncbi:hypothetical protein ACFFGR_18050 [Arthrobacter liuii]|uniref:Lipoprotein n=1 Tax=Arthrobacter liuii TaxID=1476996 RepID=A0ABQ2AW04_9MICC|nr:hypothetical protein [Arthrobacter liuii]GGH97187.1 hypothetical protein GCM10007170_26810 [Arthrobacter liuii]